jgi:hypothetical protein
MVNSIRSKLPSTSFPTAPNDTVVPESTGDAELPPIINTEAVGLESTLKCHVADTGPSA